MFRLTTPSFSFLRVTPVLLLHPKKTSRRPVRTQHTTKFWKQAKANHLTAKTLEETPDRPTCAHFGEEVDRPYTLPKGGAKCFQCQKAVDTEVEDCHNYLWIPSGNAANPYFFHKRCFHCAQCGFRFMGNKFYSLDSKAVCVTCALGRPPKYPYRWWHTNSSCITVGRAASRQTGHAFPRHQHQIEFLYDPDS